MEIWLDFVNNLLELVPVIAFAAPLIAFLVDTAKRFGLPDGYAPLVSGVLNLVVYGVVYFAGPEHEGEVRTVVEALAALGPILLGLFLSLLGTAWAHELLARIGIGYKHTPPAAG